MTADNIFFGLFPELDRNVWKCLTSKTCSPWILRFALQSLRPILYSFAETMHIDIIKQPDGDANNPRRVSHLSNGFM